MAGQVEHTHPFKKCGFSRYDKMVRITRNAKMTMRKTGNMGWYVRLPEPILRWVKVADRVLPVFFLVLFFCVFLSGLFLPIYSDEVVTKWTLSRLFFESGDAVTLFPQCSSTLDRSIPLVFYPAALLLAGLYSYFGPLGLRISGLLLTLFWFFGIAYWSLKRCMCSTDGLRSLAAMTALASLGVMPYLLAMARPEQLLVICILFFCLYPLYIKKDKGIHRQLCGAVFFILVASIFFFSHPKSIFFVLLVIASAWYSFRSSFKGFIWAIIVFILVLGVEVLHSASSLSGCSDAPLLQKILATNMLSPFLMLSEPSDFLTRGFSNLLQFPVRIVEHLEIKNIYQSGWLPALPVADAEFNVLNGLIKGFLLVLIMVSHILPLIIFFFQFASKNLSPPAVLAFLLVAGAIANAFIYEVWNFYGGGQVIPVSIMAISLLSPYIPNRLIPVCIRSIFFYCLLITAAISILTLFIKSFPLLRNNAEVEQAEIIGQPLSIPIFGIKSHIKSIRMLGEECGLSPEINEHLVVDHMTYYAYIETKQPIHILYVSELGFGGDLVGGRLLPFLKRINSPGIISRCKWIPTELKDMALSDNKGYCCVNLKKKDN